ncbi:MAG TPA: class I SAM-dependent methyltransferase [Acidobacteriota bacterium]|nr:class I SAM-dependent methyltransferase [Acidobacteriota bacterium]
MTIYRRAKRRAINWFECFDLAYRLSLRLREGGTGPHDYPDASWHNAVLKRSSDIDEAVNQVQQLGLPLVADRPKNWDSLAALDLILKRTGPDAHVFDAGGEYYSRILPWLFMYGYEHLSAGNLVFKRPVKKGPILYHYADITRTGMDGESLDVVTCLSVIEHGVDLRSYFKEMARILKPGGFLITSTDYFDRKIETNGQMAYGVPVHIFSRQEIAEALQLAAEFGLNLTGPLDLKAEEKVVHWEGYGLDYTFLIFSLQKG